MFPGVTSFPETPGYEEFSVETIALHKSHGTPFNEQQVSAMKSFHSPTVLHNDYLSENDFHVLKECLLTTADWHFNSNNSNFLGINEKHQHYQTICDIVLPKILEEHGPLNIDSFFLRDSGNSLVTHTDTRNTSPRAPYKTFLFPLGVKRQGSFSDNWDSVGTVTFDQFSYIMPIPGSSPIVDIEFGTGQPLDLNAYHKNLTHDTYERLFGLSVEQVCQWSPCSMLEFEMARLHASTDWAAHGVDSKWALTIVTTRDIPNS